VQPNRIRLKDLAARLGLEFEGDPDLELDGVAAVDEAGPSELTFVRSESWASRLAASRAAAVVAPPELDVGDRPVLRAEDPARAFYRAARLLVPEPEIPPGVHASAFVADDAEVDPSAAIGPRCVIGRRVSIGPRTVLHPGVVVEDRCEIGADCVIHPHGVVSGNAVIGDRVVLQTGAVVGAEGYGFVGAEGGGLARTYHVGRVVLEDGVEIGNHSIISRGTLGETRIGAGTKIGSLVEVAHNCRIGSNVIVLTQVGIAGGTEVGDGCVLFGQAGVAGKIRIGAGAVIAPQAGVRKSVPPGVRVGGSPSRDQRAFERINAALAYLPQLLRRVRALEAKLGLRGERP
jgi:UDP-3-O-[3-hydroxymyristoyl] glucosamine N-acyltransferase